jgi:hypothetical protein
MNCASTLPTFQASSVSKNERTTKIYMDILALALLGESSFDSNNKTLLIFTRKSLKLLYFI